VPTVEVKKLFAFICTIVIQHYIWHTSDNVLKKTACPCQIFLSSFLVFFSVLVFFAAFPLPLNNLRFFAHYVPTSDNGSHTQDSCYNMVQCVAAGHVIVGVAHLRPPAAAGQEIGQAHHISTPHVYSHVTGEKRR
jgi:hypothetical protein